MRKYKLFSALFAVAVVACDEPSAPAACASDTLRLAAPLGMFDDNAPTFREQSKPWQVYLPIAQPVDAFVKLLAACDITQDLTISLSGYLPDVAVTDEQVVGFGFSMMAPQSLKDCMLSVMLKNGAVEI
mgnify:CR=1